MRGGTGDVGCGYGQRTPPLPGKALARTSWVGLTSFSASQAGGNVDRVEGDATKLPFLKHSFDTVLCGQLLPYIGPESARAPLLKELVRVAKPEGRIVISTLHFNFRFQGFGLPKEGRNEENAWFRRDTLDEFRELLDRYVQVESMWGC
jgi:SAM-dependent methyltransferase